MRLLPFFRKAVIIKCLSFLLASSCLGLEQNRVSSKEALDLLKRERGESVTANLVSIRGHHGQNQPASWEFSTHLADGQRVFVIQNKKIVDDTIYSSGKGVVVDMRAMKTHSNHVFKIVNDAALKANVGFDSLDYELSATHFGNAPRWIVFLRNYKGKDVGRIEVSGMTPEIMNREWFVPRVVFRRPIGPNDADRKSVLKSYKLVDSRTGQGQFKGQGQGQGQGGKSIALFTGTKIKGGLLNLGTRINKAFEAQATVSTDKPRRYIPPTSRKLPGHSR